jgi:hypothetical protein
MADILRRILEREFPLDRTAWASRDPALAP